MASIREMANISEPYYNINREERNLCAILFHLLLSEDKLKKFLKIIDNRFPVEEQHMGIYFEYAFLRDIWENIPKKDGNETKKRIILDSLQLSNKKDLETSSVEEFNDFFIQRKSKSSSKHIENPGNWNINRIDKNFHDNEEFIKICEFKWCFNAKPDLVIHTSLNQAICIETKFMSKEGQYPTNPAEKEIFNKRGIKYVGQYFIQEKIMELLGIEAEYVIIANKKEESKTHKSFLWKDIFEKLDTEQCPIFIKESLNSPVLKLA